MSSRFPLQGRAVLAAMLGWMGCGDVRPCEPRNGTVNGYCDGTVAVNCEDHSECGYACGGGDQWTERPCSKGCSVTGVRDGILIFVQPIASHPTMHAVCNEWIPPADGGTSTD